MNFWSHTTATPGLLQISGLVALKPGPIRTNLPELLPIPLSDTQIFRATSVHQTSICNFLELYYGGSDWRIHVQDWLSTYLDDPKVIMLCMYRANNIIGIIVSTPLTNGNTYMSHGISLTGVRVIEGLCINPAYRGKGLAGIMINQMDHYTHTHFGPTAHLWSRETTSTPLISSALNTHMYGYIECALATPKTACEQMPWDMFVTLWKRSYIRWLNKPCIVTDTPLNRRNDLTVWIDAAQSKVAVVANTRRTSGTNTLWEVVWCGEILNDLLWPAESTEYNYFLESISAKLGHGILFTSDYIQTWNKPWVYGNSGFHSWYIYNYMPPAFRTCAVHAIREEL
jgi:hypothetical protein